MLVRYHESQCADVLVWARAQGKLLTVVDRRSCSDAVPLESRYGVALAGVDAGYVETGGGNILESYVYLTRLATDHRSTAATAYAGGQGSWGDVVTNLHGRGGLLVFNRITTCSTHDTPPCPPGAVDMAVVSDRIEMALPRRRIVASAGQPMRVLAVGGGRIIARTPAGDLIVLAPRAARAPLIGYDGYKAESRIATYTYGTGEALAAATDGRTLAVLRAGAIDVVPLPGTAGRQRSWPVHGVTYGPDAPVTCDSWGRCPRAGLRLTDLDRGIAVYVVGPAVHLLDVRTGDDVVVARPAATLATAQLEPDGLYIAAGRTVTFSPRTVIDRRFRH